MVTDEDYMCIDCGHDLDFHDIDGCMCFCKCLRKSYIGYYEILYGVVLP